MALRSCTHRDGTSMSTCPRLAPPQAHVALVHLQMELQPQQGMGPLLAWQPRPSLVTEQLSAHVARRAALGAAVVRWIPGTCTPCPTQPL